MKFKKLFVIPLVAALGLTVTGCGNDSARAIYSFDDPDLTVAQPIKAHESYVKASAEDRTDILGTLEKYAIDNYLTGMPLYGNGTLAQYSTRIKKGADKYVSGYGFGVLAEGEITSPLTSAQQPTTEWQKYYHYFYADDEKTINYGDSKGSTTNSLAVNTFAAYYETRLSADRTSYEYVPILATGDIEVANMDADGFGTVFRIPVGVGGDYRYSTLSQEEKFREFNGQEIALEDYETTVRELYDTRNDMLRGTGEGFAAGVSEIVGMAEYQAATKGGSEAEIAQAWDKVGFKAKEIDGKPYIEIEFKNELSKFYGMYYSSSYIYQPLPQKFLDTVENSQNVAGIKAMGKFTDSGLTPIDTTLSAGAYVLEEWEKDKAIVLKKNEYYAHADSSYKIEGIYYAILSAVNSDPQAAFREFEAGKLDFVSVPTTLVSTESGDPKNVTLGDTSVFKLNFNTTTPEEWEVLFGEGGTVYKTQKSDYYEVEPAMSNDDFVKGLYFALDRANYAKDRGKTPAMTFFADNYMSDPENGVVYNSTEQHKNAISEFWEGTEDTYGYNKALAQQYFKKAAEDLIAEGKYKKGDVVEIEIYWQTPSNETTYHNDIKKAFETVFNETNTGLTLEVGFKYGKIWSSVYDAMLQGAYDIGFGSISGTALNPLDFMNTLSSSNETGFTLNWGPNTSEPDQITYDGKSWSYDSLYDAANIGVVDSLDAIVRKSIRNESESRDITAYAVASQGVNLAASELSVTIEYQVIENGEVTTKSAVIEGATLSGNEVIFTIPKDIEMSASTITAYIKFKVSADLELTKSLVVKSY